MSQNEETEEYDMCQALRELAENERGGVTMCELLDKYENRGLERGLEKGLERGLERARLESIRNLMETMKLTAEQAMAALKIPEGDMAKYLVKL